MLAANSPADDLPLGRNEPFQSLPKRERTIAYSGVFTQPREKHAIDQVVAYGIAWHEGQLFGWVNQLIGLATALALVALSVSGFVMWRKRKPEGTLGAPPLPDYRPRRKGIVIIAVFFFVLLPLFAISLVVMWLFDKLVLPRLPGLARWLGVSGQKRQAKPVA